MDDPGHAGGRQLRQRLARFGGEHHGEVVVGTQLTGGADDGAHEELVEGVGPGDLGAQPAEELLQLAHARKPSRSTSLPPGYRR